MDQSTRQWDREALDTIRERFVEWVENHPDVFRIHDDESPFWWVQNCLGDILGWQELPHDWVKELEVTPKYWRDMRG